MNNLEKLAVTLETGNNEIRVDKAIIERAKRPIQRLLDFAKTQNQVFYGNNDA